MQDKKGNKDKIVRVIIIGIITSVISGTIVTYFRLYMEHRWFGEVSTATLRSDGEEGSSPDEELEEPPRIPQVSLKVFDYSSQKDASCPASAVTDGNRETVWVSKPSSPRGQTLVLSTADETLVDISIVQLCTVSSKSQQAAMAVRSVTLFSSQELQEPRTLVSLGTYTLSPGRTCHYLSLAKPSTLRVLLIQITENAGDPSVLVSEVTAYGHKHEQ